MNWEFLNRHRIRHGPLGSDESFGFNGAFSFPIDGEARRIFAICSDGMDWQHVSVSFGSKNHSTPSWDVMCKVKDLFFEPTDWVVQFHPAHSDYVNNHPGCLHLWRWIGGEFPKP